jgi:hypothetical protein
LPLACGFHQLEAAFKVTAARLRRLLAVIKDYDTARIATVSRY